jgi:hypothetical protein
MGGASFFTMAGPSVINEATLANGKTTAWVHEDYFEHGEELGPLAKEVGISTDAVLGDPSLLHRDVR